MIADSSTVPALEKKLAYRTRLMEAEAVAKDDAGEWNAELADETDKLVLSALNALYDPKDPHRVQTARRLLISAHLNLVVSARRERVGSAS